jgi:hypothetical protein
MPQFFNTDDESEPKKAVADERTYFEEMKMHLEERKAGDLGKEEEEDSEIGAIIG